MAQPVFVIGDGDLGVEHGPVADNQVGLLCMAVVTEPAGQLFHVAHHRGLVSRASRPRGVGHGNIAVSADIRPQFELALIAGRVVGKAEIHQLAALIPSMSHNARQIIEEYREVDLGLGQGDGHDLLPDHIQMGIQCIQRAAQAVVVELGAAGMFSCAASTVWPTQSLI